MNKLHNWWQMTKNIVEPDKMIDKVVTKEKPFVARVKPFVARETPCYYGNPLLLGKPKPGKPFVARDESN